MGIVLGKAAHTHQAVHHARPLVAVHRAQLGPADRQFPVAAQLAGVGEHVERAVHRLELVLPLVHLHGAEHALGVEIEVAGGLPEADVGHVGRVEQLVAPFEVSLAPELLDQQTHAGATGVPEHQSSTSFILD